MSKLEQELMQAIPNIAKTLSRGNNVEIKREGGDKIKVYKVEKRTIK